MKKLLTLILACVLGISCILLQGCSEEKTENNDNGGIFESTLTVSDLSIDDFEWKTVPSKYQGKDCYTFSLINNSDYDIIAVEFTYKVKKDVTDDELKVYDEFMKDHDGYIEKTDSPKDVIIRGNKDTLVPKGKQLTGLRFTVGFQNWTWHDYPTDEQFKLMEPKEMQLGIVDDNKLYIAYYDFEDKSWKLDEDTEIVDTWSEKEIAKKISKPAEEHHILIEDETDEFKIYSYGITTEEFNKYVEKIKKSGFKEEHFTSSSFEGKTADGYKAKLWYYSEEERLSIKIEKESQ